MEIINDEAAENQERFRINAQNILNATWETFASVTPYGTIFNDAEDDTTVRQHVLLVGDGQKWYPGITPLNTAWLYPETYDIDDFNYTSTDTMALVPNTDGTGIIRVTATNEDYSHSVVWFKSFSVALDAHATQSKVYVGTMTSAQLTRIRGTVAPPLEGHPSVVGNGYVGYTVRADTSTITDANGLATDPAWAYQWQRSRLGSTSWSNYRAQDGTGGNRQHDVPEPRSRHVPHPGQSVPIPLGRGLGSQRNHADTILEYPSIAAGA